MTSSHHVRAARSHPYGSVPQAVVEATASAEHIGAAVRAVAGDPLQIGPLAAGPGGLARADANGHVRQVLVTRDDDADLLSYVAALDVHVTLDVAVSGRSHRYDVELMLPLRVTVTSATEHVLQSRATAPLADDVTAVLRPHGLHARLLAKVGNVQAIVRQEAAARIGRRLEHDDARAAMVLPLPATGSGPR